MVWYRRMLSARGVWPLSLGESTVFINSQVNMLLWPKAAAHFPPEQGAWVAWGNHEPSMWNVGSSPRTYFCSILCVVFCTVCSHEDYDCLSVPKFCPLGGPLSNFFSFASLCLLTSRSSSPPSSPVSLKYVFFWLSLFQSPCFAFHLLPWLVHKDKTIVMENLGWEVKWEHIYSLFEAWTE